MDNYEGGKRDENDRVGSQDIGKAESTRNSRSSGAASSLDVTPSAHQSQSQQVTNPAQPPHPHSEATQQVEPRGRQRRRERRWVHHEERRQGGSSGGSSYPSYGSRSRSYRSRGDDWGMEKDYDLHERRYYRDRGDSRDHQRHRRGSSYNHGRDYDYGSYSRKNRSRSPTSIRRRDSYRSFSNERSNNGRSQLSRSRSHSVSRSRSRSVRSFESEDERDGEGRSDSRGKGSRERIRSEKSPDRNLEKSNRRRRRDSTSSTSSEDEPTETVKDESTFSKDQRTVFVSQLVMRATEKDIRRYFRRKVGCKVKEVILLKDKRTGNHKGCAYIEMQRVEDVNKAVAVAGLPPDFQRFPILTKASEAEKNYVIPASSSVITASMIGSSAAITPFLTQDGKVVQSQKVYVGGLDPSVSEEHLFALFSQFGQLEKVNMQIDPTTKNRRGFAFLSFKDPKVGNLAIKTMSNQFLAGRSLKTGWASQSHPIPGIDIVESDELPENSEGRAQMAFAVLAQLTGTSTSGQSASGADSAKSGSMTWSVGTSVDSSQAESVLTSSAGEAKVVIKDLPSGVTKIKNEVRIPANAAAIDTIGNVSVGSSTVSGKPSRSILAHNMFDKDKETENGWANDLKEEFTEECSKFGKLMSVTVMSTEEGGKIYATFETRDAASTCASNLAGRWFDKRQLRIEFVDDADVPS